ncbi:oligopeptide/dipeptide ABC transporter ATP-binding protein, partial [Micromonospora sp. NPDC051141]|uniref:oligopeptide/dipeptide ABC transporter ATP-binding protein n=1 Tax=Micromonospora sp. NPDC051141 TaxID=3364284 RepID=UPI0037AB38D7
RLTGDVPTPLNPPSGCRFRTRCWKATDRCATETPALTTRDGGTQLTACHHPENAPITVSTGSGHLTCHDDPERQPERG